MYFLSIIFLHNSYEMILTIQFLHFRATNACVNLGTQENIVTSILTTVLQIHAKMVADVEMESIRMNASVQMDGKDHIAISTLTNA